MAKILNTILNKRCRRSVTAGRTIRSQACCQLTDGGFSVFQSEILLADIRDGLPNTCVV